MPIKTLRRPSCGRSQRRDPVAGVPLAPPPAEWSGQGVAGGSPLTVAEASKPLRSRPPVPGRRSRPRSSRRRPGPPPTGGARRFSSLSPIPPPGPCCRRLSSDERWPSAADAVMGRHPFSRLQKRSGDAAGTRRHRFLSYRCVTVMPHTTRGHAPTRSQHHPYGHWARVKRVALKTRRCGGRPEAGRLPIRAGRAQGRPGFRCEQHARAAPSFTPPLPGTCHSPAGRGAHLRTSAAG